MIYYFAPDYNGPAGGIKVIYRHVDILNTHGINSCVLHGKRNFRCTWFENTTMVQCVHDVQIKADDVVIMPEIFYHLLADLRINIHEKIKNLIGHKTDYFAAKILWKSTAKKVIFNQNAYHTFLDFDDNYLFKTDYIQHINSIITISENSKKYLEYSFGNSIKIYRVFWSLNRAKYSYNEAGKQHIISYMPRKNTPHSSQLMRILQQRNKLPEYTFVPIHNMSETEVINVLQKSSIFLSFGYPEGLPLPPAEAMACGCIVIGYHGGGGEEYFHPDFCYHIPYGDILAFVQCVEDVAKDMLYNTAKYHSMRQHASRYILDTYSPENEINTLLQTIKYL
ncbi:MAG: glycosyltransferase [Cytophagales bacterium]|nr:glycosyltransferase [Cytophagales bacterium]